MTKYLVDGETLTDIADAIREQTGESSPIMLSDFAQQIAAISGGVNYSADEQAVGTWIDGSVVYQKSYTGSVSGNQTTITTLTETIKLIGGEGSVVKNDGAQMILGCLGTANDWRSGVHIASDNLYLFTANEITTGTYYVTIKYIKVNT